MKNNRIRLAIQKSGRLSEESINLLNRCGIKFNRSKDQLFYHSENFPIDLLLIRDDDIPHLVKDNICEFGIVGENILQELNADNNSAFNQPAISIVRALGFGKCRLSLAIPNNFSYQDITTLNNTRIATSYPNLLNKFLRDNAISANIIPLNGSVEIAPRLGIADLICDLVSTGATLAANGLREIIKILESRAILIRNNRSLDLPKQETAMLFAQRLQGVLQANESKYIMLHAPKNKLSQIVQLLPGAEHPTITALDGDNEKIGLHAVCHEAVFWETLEKLKACGASSILVLPVEKMLL